MDKLSPHHARDLSPKDIDNFFRCVSNDGRQKDRNKVIACLNFYAGLSAKEIAGVRWGMVLGDDGLVGASLHLEAEPTKKLSGRVIPLKAETREALSTYLNIESHPPRHDDFILRSERGGGMKPQSIINWFRIVYDRIGLPGASSHSGRRYFVAMAARRIGEAGGSLRDVKVLAGHKSLASTHLYIPESSDAKTKVVDLL
jgi:integrase/recombinase XerC